MVVITVYFIQRGRNNTRIEIGNEKPFAELVNRFFRLNGIISQKDKDSLRFIFEGLEISSYDKKLHELYIRNSSQIRVTTATESNMETGRDNWRDGIIQGRGQFSFVSEEDKNYIFNALRENVSKKPKNRLYSATEDGDTARKYHEKCDNKGALFYLIKTTDDKVFGIYLSNSISSEGGTKTGSTQMVVCPYKKFAILSKNKNNATYYCCADKGALFHCMKINAPFLSSDCEDIISCNDFDLPYYPSGSSIYRIKELEVYSLENSS